MAFDYVCEECHYRAKRVTEDYDCGMDAEVFTPVVCEIHGVAWGETGLKARGEEWPRERDSYPCERCGRLSPRWDRVTCPRCGRQSMKRDTDNVTMWD